MTTHFNFIRRASYLIVFALGLLARGWTANAQTNLPAFPGAEGFGAFARGGRGGDVYHVVNLNGSGAGSFAYGLQTVPAAGRTIVFDVSGYIRIGGTLTLSSDKVTIAGQTAPGDGIGFTNGTFNISAQDVIVRHVRFRNGYSADAVDLDSTAANIILDHCDVMLSNDENLSSFSSPPENFSFQWCINAWGMESHSAGGLWDQKHATAHHTLWSHNHTRNPKARPDGLLDWVNNVTFDYDIGFIMGDSATPANWKANVRGSYFISTSSTGTALEKANLDRNGGTNFSLFLEGCALDGNANGLLDVSKSNYSMASGTYITLPGAVPQTANSLPVSGTNPIVGVPVTRDDYLTAYKKIVSQVGPARFDAATNVVLRDELTTKLINNLLTQTRHHVSSPAGTGAGNGGWGFLLSAPAPADTDRDGMPDFWESAVGLNPLVDDHNLAVTNSGGFVTANSFFPTNTPAGYTYLEEYLHWLAVPHATALRDTPADFDLHKFTKGFTNRTPVVYSVTNSTNGTVTLTNGFIAHFLPATNFFGRAKFDFTVTDADGSTWTQTMALLISPQAPPKSLLWVGDNLTNKWDVLGATNWSDGTALVTFGTGDTVTFDDSGSTNPAVNLTGALLPGAVSVNADDNFTFGGAGSLGGAMSLAKSGNGRLTLSTTNAFSGGVTVDDGTLVLNAPAGAGTGPITLSGGALSLTAAGGPATYGNNLNLAAPATISSSVNQALTGAWTNSAPVSLNVSGIFSVSGNLSGFSNSITMTGGGTFRFMTGSTGSGAAAFDLGTSNALMHARDGNATIALGSLSGGPATTLRGAGTTANPTTYLIGGNSNDTTFAGSILNGGAGAGATTALIKTGGGALTLAGANMHTGTTTVSNGMLIVNGIFTTSAVTVSGGALAGSGILGGGLTVNSGAALAPGSNSAPGTVGILTVSNGVALNSPTLYFDLSSSPAGANDKVTLAGGLLTMSGTQTWIFNLTDGVLGAGTYTLMDGGTNTSAAGVGLAHNLPAGARQTFALARPSSGNGQCYVQLNVTGNPATLTWRGTNGSAWDTNTTFNWDNAGASDRYFDFDAVTFNDTATNGSVVLAGNVVPRSLLVSNSATTYVLDGGSFSGATVLTKSGGGTLTLVTNNPFTGGTLLGGGTIAVSNNGALGTGTVVFTGGTLLFNSAGSITNNFVIAAPSTLFAFGNCTTKGTTTGTNTTLTLKYTSSGSVLTFEKSLAGFTGLMQFTNAGILRFNQGASVWGLPNATLDAGSNGLVRNRRLTAGPVYLGALSGKAGSKLTATDQTNSPGALDTYIVGGLNSNTTFGGAILDTAHVLAIQKVGTGTWTLTGTNAYTGGTLVSEGALLVNNTNGSGTGAGTVTVAAGATLGGTGSIAGQVSVQSGGILAPGASIGTLTVDDDLVLNDGAVLQFEIGATNDRVAVTGSLDLGGTLNITATNGFTNGTFTLFTYGGALSVGALTLGTTPPGFFYAIDTATPGAVKLRVLTAFEQWQIARFGSTTNANAAANFDADGDGRSNWEEFIAGTDPTAFSSNPLTITNAAGKPLVSFTATAASGTGYTGLTRFFDLLSTSNLTVGPWPGVPNHTNIPGSNQLVTHTNAGGTNTHFKLQIRLQ